MKRSSGLDTASEGSGGQARSATADPLPGPRRRGLWAFCLGPEEMLAPIQPHPLSVNRKTSIELANSERVSVRWTKTLVGRGGLSIHSQLVQGFVEK